MKSNQDQIEADREHGLSHPRGRTALYGHDDAQAVLAQAFARGAMPTAWLIGGPKGVGKATLAYRFARRLLAGGKIAAEDPSAFDLAPDHPVCRLVAAQAHPGLLVLKRPFDDKGERLRKNITVDEVRRIHGHFGLSGQAAGYRVCLVDAADDLSEEGANALLKTLEEPPQRAVFLVLAHAPARLLATIRSRCRRLLLKPLETHAIEAVLAKENPGLAPGDRRLIAALAGGAPGRALALAAGDGLALYREMRQLLKALPRLDSNHVHDFAGRLSAPKAEQDYRIAQQLFTGLMERLIQIGAGASAKTVPPEEEMLLAHLNAAASLDRWVDVWEKINGLEKRADGLSLDRKQILLSKFTALARVASGADSGL